MRVFQMSDSANRGGGQLETRGPFANGSLSLLAAEGLSLNGLAANLGPHLNPLASLTTKRKCALI